MPDPSLRRPAAVASLASGVAFLTGISLQVSAGWFPEDALAAGDLGGWLEAVTSAQTAAYVGLVLCALGIVLWMAVGLYLSVAFRGGQPAWAAAGLVGFLAGTTLALAGFVFAFGATVGLVGSAEPPSEAVMAGLLRGFLMCDDAATALIGGVGVGSFAWAGWRSGRLPRWLAVHGMVAAALVLVMPLRYLEPAFAAAYPGAPLLLVWFVALGGVLLRRGLDAEAAPGLEARGGAVGGLEAATR